jgi:hypothetical protein
MVLGPADSPTTDLAAGSIDGRPGSRARRACEQGQETVDRHPGVSLGGRGRLTEKSPDRYVANHQPVEQLERLGRILDAQVAPPGRRRQSSIIDPAAGGADQWRARRSGRWA